MPKLPQCTPCKHSDTTAPVPNQFPTTEALQRQPETSQHITSQQPSANAVRVRENTHQEQHDNICTRACLHIHMYIPHLSICADIDIDTGIDIDINPDTDIHVNTPSWLVGTFLASCHSESVPSTTKCARSSSTLARTGRERDKFRTPPGCTESCVLGEAATAFKGFGVLKLRLAKLQLLRQPQSARLRPRILDDCRSHRARPPCASAALPGGTAASQAPSNAHSDTNMSIISTTTNTNIPNPSDHTRVSALSQAAQALAGKKHIQFPAGPLVTLLCSCAALKSQGHCATASRTTKT